MELRQFRLNAQRCIRYQTNHWHFGFFFFLFFFFFLVSYVGDRPWWPMQSPNNGRKEIAKGKEERDQIKLIYLRYET